MPADAKRTKCPTFTALRVLNDHCCFALGADGRVYHYAWGRDHWVQMGTDYLRTVDMPGDAEEADAEVHLH